MYMHVYVHCGVCACECVCACGEWAMERGFGGEERKELRKMRMGGG